MGERRLFQRVTAVVVTAATLVVVALAGAVFLGGQTPRSLGPAPRMIYGTTGDWDVACSGTGADGNPAGCSTPLPSLEPAAVAAASPLKVAAIDIPITAIGPLEVYVGEATLANGVLHKASFRVDGIAEGVQVLPPGLDVAAEIRLEVRPTDPSRPPFGNGYARGWHTGVETVNVYLVMDVTRFDPGTIFRLRDVVVQ